MLGPPVFAQQPPAPIGDPVVVVSGEGVVQAVPDRAWITVGAESRAPSAREAQKRNTDLMTPILEKLRGAGLPPDAIRTIGYDVQYEWDFVNNRRVGRGYVARNTVEVRVDTIDRVGDYLEIAGGSGATTLGGIRFDLKDKAKLEREALRWPSPTPGRRPNRLPPVPAAPSIASSASRSAEWQTARRFRCRCSGPRRPPPQARLRCLRGRWRFVRT